MNKFDGIILDIDGTIWNTTPIVAVAWNRAIKNCNFNQIKPVTAEILQKEFGKTMDVIAQDLWPELNSQQQKLLMKECCICEQEELENNQTDITYPSVIETIKKLSDSINFYIVSNCQDGYIELTMKKNNITSCIKDIECFGHSGKEKADNIADIVKRNNLKSPVYIGDTSGDQKACEKAGVPFIWASYGFGTSDNHLAKISIFSELEKLL